MDASSNTAAITQAALQDVTRFLDRTEENLRSLTVNPYMNTKHDEEAMLLSGNIPSMTQEVENDIPVDVRIPHRCAVNREYRSRPRRRQLDWIISTNPLQVQPITASELDSESGGVPEEPRIFVLLEPLPAPSSTVEENVLAANELENELTGTPREPRILDKSTGKWRRRYLGKKKSRTVLLEHLSVASPTMEDHAPSSQSKALEKKKGDVAPPSSRDPMFQSVSDSSRYKTDIEADLLKTARELEQIGLKALSEIELSKTAWREKINVGVGSHVKMVDVSNASSEGIGEKEIVNTVQPLTAPNPLTSELQMQQAQASPRTRLKRPSLAEVEIQKDLNSDDFVSPKSSKISDLTQTSLLTSRADDEESKKTILRKSDIKSDNTPHRRRRLPRPFRSDISMLENKTRSGSTSPLKNLPNRAAHAIHSLAATAKCCFRSRKIALEVQGCVHTYHEVRQQFQHSAQFECPELRDQSQTSVISSRRGSAHKHDAQGLSQDNTLTDFESMITAQGAPTRPLQQASVLVAVALKARLRMRAKAARIRERKRLSRAANDVDECCCSPRITPLRDILDDRNRVIQLEPLKAPISVDSSRTITFSNEQINLTQILRIYGSGNVEEPYDVMPQRLARKRIRGALANVLCGTNIIEIRLINTAIHSSKRGQVNNWIFTHDEDVHTTPIVFAKTVLLQDHPPAPFCLSVASPFWVSIYQEQVVSSKRGERFRDCVEVRSCKGSDMPCFEMSPLQSEVHPLFKERIYLGKGVIRIERNVDLPSDRESSEWFSNSTRISTQQQYRIQLPWRQTEGQPETGIPRAPQLTEIRTTNHPHICIPEQQNKPYRKARPQKTKTTSSSAMTSPVTSTSSYFNDNASSSLSEGWSAPKKKGFSNMNEHPTAIQKRFKEPPVLKSPQKLNSGTVRSKRSLQMTNELSQGDTLPISPTQESMEEVSHDLSSSPTQDSFKEDSETTYAGEEAEAATTSPMSTDTSAGTTSSLGYFEYGVELEGAQNDIVTAVALPPVLLHIRRRKGDPLRNTGSVSYKYAVSKKKSKSSKLHSRSSSAGKSKIEFKNRRHLADELADNLYAGDVVVHEKLAGDTLKLQLHITSKIKDASKEEEDARFLPDRITVQGKDIWSDI